jgi:signal transduction histidine kinase
MMGPPRICTQPVSTWRVSMTRKPVEEQQNNLKNLETMLKQVANTLRDIVENLRPPTIANLGLERAIRSYAGKVQEEHPELELKLHLTRDGQELPHHTRLALFRIFSSAWQISCPTHRPARQW